MTTVGDRTSRRSRSERAVRASERPAAGGVGATVLTRGCRTECAG